MADAKDIQPEIEKDLSALQRKYRNLVHHGTVEEKVSVIKQILEINPDDAAWRSTLRELESAWKEKLTQEAREAIRNGDVAELERIQDLLRQVDWQVPPQPEALAKLETVLAQLYQKQWEREGQAICERLDRQYRDDLEGGLEKMAEWFGQWDELRSEHPAFVPTEEQEKLIALIRPNWWNLYQGRLRQEAEDQDYARLAAQLEQAIKAGASQKELLEIYDELARLERDIPETFLQRYDTALEQARLREHRRAVISRVFLVLVLLLVGGVAFFCFREWSFRELTIQYSNQLRPILDEPTRDVAEADAIFEEIKKNREALLARPEFQEALRQLAQKKKEQAAIAAKVQDCGGELRELLPHYRENRQRIAELRKELQDLSLVPDMAEERNKILADYEQATRQFVAAQDRRHSELLSALPKKYEDFHALLDSCENLAQARQLLDEMRDILSQAGQLEGVSDAVREECERWQGRLKDDAKALINAERLEGVLDTIRPTLKSLRAFVELGEKLSFSLDAEAKAENDRWLPSDFSLEQVQALVAQGESFLGQEGDEMDQLKASPQGREVLGELEQLLEKAKTLEEGFSRYETALKQQADDIWKNNDLQGVQEAVEEFLAVAPQALSIAQEIRFFKEEQLHPLQKFKELDRRVLDFFDEMDQAWKAFLKQESTQMPVYYMIALEGKNELGQKRSFNLFVSENGLSSFDIGKDKAGFRIPIVVSSRDKELVEEWLPVDLIPKGNTMEWHYRIYADEILAEPRIMSVLDKLEERQGGIDALQAPHFLWMAEALERSRQRRRAGDAPLLGNISTYDFLGRLFYGYNQDAPYPRAVLAERLLLALLETDAAKAANDMPFVNSLRALQQDVHELLQEYGAADQWELRHAMGDGGTAMLAGKLDRIGKENLPVIKRQALSYLFTAFQARYAEAGVIYWNYSKEKYALKVFSPAGEEEPPEATGLLFYINPDDHSMSQYGMVENTGNWPVKSYLLDKYKHLIIFSQK